MPSEGEVENDVNFRAEDVISQESGQNLPSSPISLYHDAEYVRPPQQLTYIERRFVHKLEKDYSYKLDCRPLIKCFEPGLRRTNSPSNTKLTDSHLHMFGGTRRKGRKFVSAKDHFATSMLGIHLQQLTETMHSTQVSKRR